MNRDHEFWITDYKGNRLLFAYVTSVDEGREMWHDIAGIHIGQNLTGFEVVKGDKVLYEGDYITDEC